MKSLDPKIERVISKCLKPEVDERPVSALAVAARCLAAIRSRPLSRPAKRHHPRWWRLRAVATSFRFARRWLRPAWIVLSLLAVVLLYQRVILLNRVPLPKPPAALQDRAQRLASLGFDPAAAVDTASGLGLSLDYARFIEATSTAPIGGTSFAQCGPRHSSSGTAPVLSCLFRGEPRFPSAERIRR